MCQVLRYVWVQHWLLFVEGVDVCATKNQRGSSPNATCQYHCTKQNVSPTFSHPPSRLSHSDFPAHVPVWLGSQWGDSVQYHSHMFTCPSFPMTNAFVSRKGKTCSVMPYRHCINNKSQLSQLPRCPVGIWGGGGRPHCNSDRHLNFSLMQD